MNAEQAEKIINFALGDYAPIRDTYRMRIYAAMLDYLANDGNMVAKRNEFKRAIAEGFGDAADLGFVDGGGELPDQPLNDWVGGRMEQEFTNVDALFRQLKDTRGDEEFNRAEAFDIANQRADGYAATLDGIYNEAKVRGAKNRLLTFGGEDGHSPGFPCKTCAKLKGQRHRASWWIRRGLIPYPGNANYECGAWQCKHILFDDQGRIFTV